MWLKSMYKSCKWFPKSSYYITDRCVKAQKRTLTIISNGFLRCNNITYKKLCFDTKSFHNTIQDVTMDKQEHNPNTFTYRTHTCGDLRAEHEGHRVTLCGWVQFCRLSKFLLLRDGYGLTQCVVNNELNISEISLETIVRIEGVVAVRPNDMVNHNMATGKIEVIVDKLDVQNTADKLPFNLREYQKPKEQLRLQHRYIDLRFPEMQSNLRLRSTMLHNMRRFLVEQHAFVEVETPTLFCRTPGGAREFVVPTHHKGLFFSLVQSPQQFKQMLMSGGIDRYFQIARCYRDETTRPDRQPEFTQLDIELSFTNLDGVLSMVEQLLYNTYTKPIPRPPFKRMTYKEAIQSYGSDKPNLCYDLKFVNINKLFPEKSEDNDFGAYALPYTNKINKLTAKYREKIREYAKKYSCKVVLFENIAKELGADISERIKHRIGVPNAAIIALGDADNSALCLGEIRLMIASLLDSHNMLVVKHDAEPLWIVDFPLFVKGDNGLESCHHPFTAPHQDDMHLLDTEPLKVRSLAYDLVVNGNEVGGGSIRIHNAQLQENIMKILNIDPGTMTHFLNALKCGCPPHGGIALGIDRLVTMASNAESIRDVIAFPKSHDGRDPLSGAPNTISEDDKQYYHICTV